MAETSKKNEKVGSVISSKMAKTIVVEVIRRVPHPLYKRIISKRRKFYAHDEQSEAKVGDVVCVVPTVNPDAVTPHSEAFQAVIWHLLVSHPALKLKQTKWEGVGSAPASA